MLSLRKFLNRRRHHPVGEAWPTGCKSLRYMLTQATFAENLVDGDEVLPHLIGDLMHAKQEINIAWYLFYNDPAGKEIAKTLIDKAQEPGNPLLVRLLMDIEKTRIGHPFVADDTLGLVEKMRAAGVKVLNSHIDYEKVIATGNPQYDTDATAVRNTLSDFTTAVDHRKLITIDGTVAYCGSANCGAEYLFHLPFNPQMNANDEAQARDQGNQPEAWEKWHDGMVRFIGPIVPHLDEIFHERWVLDGGADYAAVPYDLCHTVFIDGSPINGYEIVAGQPDGKPNGVRELYLRMIKDAKQSIFIENPYLYHPAIVDALIQARQRNPNLQIDIIVPDALLNDMPLCADANRFRYQRYIPAGIHIYEYKNHMAHLKVATFDDRFAIVGSSNLNYRSMENDRDFELVILVDDPEFAQSINTCVRDVDIPRSREFKRDDVQGFGCDLWPINCRTPVTIAVELAREL